MDKGNGEFIIHSSLQESISNDMSLYKILYFVAPYGWGKTTQIQIWRNSGSGKQTGGIVYLNCKDTELVLDRIQKMDVSIPQTFIFDDFHKADKDKIYSELDAVVNRSDDRVKMIFLSRVKIPDFLLIPLLSGRLKIYTIKELMIPLECALRYFGDSGIRLSALEIQNYEKHFAGYPLFIKLLRDQLVEDRTFLDEKLIMANAYNLYRVFDTCFLAKWSKRVQRFLMCVAGMPTFSMELAKAVYGPGSVEEIIEEILDTGSFMSQVGGNRYFIQENFNRYLSYTREKHLDPSEITAIYNKTAAYYESCGKVNSALEYYRRAGNHEKIQLLLIELSKAGALAYDLFELKPYYMILTENELMSHPNLVGGLSMLYSIMWKPEQSEYWYKKLCEMKRSMDKKDPLYRMAEEQMVYLGIGMPHRGTKGMMQLLFNGAQYFIKNGMKMQNISITGNRPSLMNGGKDFCAWAPNAEPLKRMLGGVIGSLFKEQAAGLVDIGVGEAYYERNDLNGSLNYLTKGLAKSRKAGNLEMQFAGIGTLIRLMMAQNQTASALQTLQGFREVVFTEQKKNLMPNLEAFGIKIMMIRGDLANEKIWFKEYAPDETKCFRTIDRYGYSVKVRSYILRKRYSQALLLLEELRAYTQEYDRKYDYLEASLLRALILYRTGDKQWKEELREVLDKAGKYPLVRLIADEGAAVVPLLKTLKSDDEMRQVTESGFFANVLGAAGEMAEHYPDYLKEKEHVVLTHMEKQVGMLLMKGYQNKEISQALNISLNTVKFHLKNIYMKLGVKTRAKAVMELVLRFSALFE